MLRLFFTVAYLVVALRGFAHPYRLDVYPWLLVGAGILVVVNVYYLVRDWRR